MFPIKFLNSGSQGKCLQRHKLFLMIYALYLNTLIQTPQTQRFHFHFSIWKPSKKRCNVLLIWKGNKKRYALPSVNSRQTIKVEISLKIYSVSFLLPHCRSPSSDSSNSCIQRLKNFKYFLVLMLKHSLSLVFLIFLLWARLLGSEGW